MKELAPLCRSIVGIDISRENVEFGREYLKEMENAQLLVMDAHHIQLEASFDVILCLQNGLSAMKVEPMEYVKEVMALLSADGKAFFQQLQP